MAIPLTGSYIAKANRIAYAYEASWDIIDDTVAWNALITAGGTTFDVSDAIPNVAPGQDVTQYVRQAIERALERDASMNKHP
jgi:hypothetical protein